MRLTDLPPTRRKIAYYVIAAIVKAVTYFNDPVVLAEVSTGLGEPMVGIEMSALGEDGLLQTRGW